MYYQLAIIVKVLCIKYPRCGWLLSKMWLVLSKMWLVLSNLFSSRHLPLHLKIVCIGILPLRLISLYESIDLNVYIYMSVLYCRFLIIFSITKMYNCRCSELGAWPSLFAVGVGEMHVSMCPFHWCLAQYSCNSFATYLT